MMRETDKSRPHEGDMNFANLLALNRVGEVEDVANLIEFLLSDKSSFITGAEINIDGGWI
jgi:NAD(P)-dependent dehydrogenase (short-subunit alcohol dehydrogenase family)